MSGSTIIINGVAYIIASISSAKEAVLTTTYSGTTATGVVISVQYWVVVPNQQQNQMEIQVDGSGATAKFGSPVTELFGCTLFDHNLAYWDSGTSSFKNKNIAERTVSGQWYYNVPSDSNITGLRIMGRGVFGVGATSLGVNYLQLQSNGNETCEIGAVTLGVISMRDR